MKKIFSKFFNFFSKEKRKFNLKKYYKVINKINSLSQFYHNKTDEELKTMTNFFKQQLSSGVKMDDILPDVFAVGREAARRTLGMYHFDVQLLGAIVLHKGAISEMKTGEGKTFVATLAIYLNALSGNPVHVITVNDYLAKRDYEWMKPMYDFLQLKSGYINSETDHEERNEIYKSDIIYVTNNEIGFDYLRDNMKYSINDMNLILRGFCFAIVDEVDSILIDEARTPLILSGQNNDSNMILYKNITNIIKKFKNTDYEIDEKHKSIQLTNEGSLNAEKILKDANIIPRSAELYSVKYSHILNIITQILKAHYLFSHDVDYIVQNGQVKIVDEFTGRILEGRKYSEGLHQAIEAKEGLKISKENKVLASTTYQNFFRMYNKLSGMTGTAKTEANEFYEIYGLTVVEIPTHRKVQRVDHNDLIFKSLDEKISAIVNKIEELHKKGQPILIGTITIEISQKISDILKKKGMKHNILNAKNHEMEADIIADAGKLGAITIATNMAGRGTDIMLGGNLKKIIQKIPKDSENFGEKIIKAEQDYSIERHRVIDSGGLFVIGTERHENRRIDNQLIGRSGRQGDRGESQCFISLQDELMRIFGGERISSVIDKFGGLKANESMSHKMLNSIVSKSQYRVQNFHYEIRKSVLKYGNITKQQEDIIYNQRLLFLKSDNIQETIKSIIQDFNQDTIEMYNDDNAIINHLSSTYSVNKKDFYTIFENIKSDKLKKINDFAIRQFNNKFINANRAELDHILKTILVSNLDKEYEFFLNNIINLKESIHLRAYAQKDPFVEFKIESYKLLDELFFNLLSNSLKVIFKIDVQS